MLVAINAIPPSTASSNKALWKVFFYSAKDSKLAVESNQWFVCVCVCWKGKDPKSPEKSSLCLSFSCRFLGLWLNSLCSDIAQHLNLRLVQLLQEALS